MTKEELEKEAVEYCANNCGDCYGCHKKYRKNKNCEKIKSMIKTYLASAEPREIQLQEKDNKIIELEKENEDAQYINMKVMDENSKLEKENAELKEQISIKDILIIELQEQKVYWKESSFDWRHKFFKLDKVKRLIKKDKELAKAKDILKRCYENYIYLEPLRSEIEQFLKGNK